MLEPNELKRKIQSLEKENQDLIQIHSETEKLSKIGSYKINLDTGVVEWTDGLREIFGLTLEDDLPTPESYYDYIYPDERETVMQMFSDSATKNTPFDYKYRIVLKNDIIKNVHSKSNVVTDSDGNHLLVGFFRDISEEVKIQQMKELVEETEKQKNLIVDSSSEVITYYNLDLEIVWTNKVASKILGKSPKELIGLKCYKTWHNSDVPCKNCPVLKTKKKLSPQESEITTSDGRIWHLRSYPVFDKNNKLVALSEFGLDITDKRKKDLIIKESEKKYKQLVENAPFGIVVFSEKKTVFANNYLVNLLNVRNTESIYKRKFTDYIHPNDKERFKQILKSSIEQESYSVNNYRVSLVKGKNEIIVEILITLIHSNGSTLWQCIVKDISEETRIRNKAKRLSTDALYLSRKLSLSDNLKTDLENVIKENRFPEFPFQTIFNVIKAEINLEELWHVFQENFELVYEGFFKKLIHRAPNLTQQELKHCAFIKMNFETKEIATMFNIKPTSVQIGRVRIKKKLKLDSEQELLHCILTL